MSEYHNAVLLKESVDALCINESGIYIDVTYGGGGHSEEILKRLGSKGKLLAFDQDVEARKNVKSDERLIFLPSNFRYIYKFWRWLKIDKIDGILADLGVSSHQFDEGGRGFSYRFDALLDMRMNEESMKKASDILMNYSSEELQAVFSKYGEVRNSRKLASRIVEERKRGRNLTTSFSFNNLLDEVCIGDKMKYYSQVYQALRIEVNEEMEALSEMLGGGIRVLKKGGRFVAISYHSLEDRLVKRFFKAGNQEGVVEKDEYGRSLAPMKMIGKLIVPSDEEQKLNIRSRSAKMRVAERY